VDDDFEFEFFPDEETKEVAPERPSPRLGRLRSPADEGPPDRMVKRRRLAAGIAAGIVLVTIIVVFATQGSSGPRAADRSYLAKLAPIATDSQQVGRSLTTLLAQMRTGSARGDPLTTIGRLIGRARRDLSRAQGLKPPSGLQAVHQQALSALDFRVTGLQALHDVLGRDLGSTDAGSYVTALSAAIDRLVTSDVVWEDRFRAPAAGVILRVGLTPASAPQSRFVADPNVSSPQSTTTLLQPQPGGATGTRLTVGSQGAAVVAWQRRLNRWLKLTAPTQTPLPIDGTFGPATQTATEALQRAEGITPDGVVGPATRQALQRALAG
jgi:hypothetical protein